MGMNMRATKLLGVGRLFPIVGVGRYDALRRGMLPNAKIEVAFTASHTNVMWPVVKYSTLARTSRGVSE
jgi:hypothetical protein